MADTDTKDKSPSSSCDNLLTNSEKQLSKTVCEMDPCLKEKLKDIPQALEYIEKLQKLIRKQMKKINKWRIKVKKIKKLKNVSTQTDLDTNNFNSNKEVKNLMDDIKEAAEIAVQNSGFVYEATSGMYYDYSTGYYYNAEYGLYYDGTSGTYLKYNQDTCSYEFHSQVAGTQTQTQKREKIDKDVRKKRKHKNVTKLKVKTSSDLEDLMYSFNNLNINKLRTIALDISKQWPPCMRIIVEVSNIPKVKVGSLHVITYDGGSVGREGDHSILIPDINISKHHLKFIFNKETNYYYIIDLGSRNGTLLNGKRMSPSKKESDPMKITHGTKIQIGSTVLLCHIHEGNQTCGHCEPGLLQFPKAVENKSINRSSRSEQHKIELKHLKKVCGVDEYEDPKLASGYTDRAQKRRETIGSQNPYEKTKIISIDESLNSDNKGFKLLSKMGWKEGQSLGKDAGGLLEPITLVSNNGTCGIGCTEKFVDNPVSTGRQNIWKKAQERFEKLPDR